MPTRPRIDIAGYHHIINRGVDRMNIFRHSEDKDSFLQIVNRCKLCSIFQELYYLFGLCRRWLFSN